MKKLNENLSEIFDIEPIEIVEKSTTELVTIESGTDVDIDANFARENIKQLISKTINSIPDTINNNKFIIIDHSPVMEAIYRINSISERRALFLLFNYIKNEFQYSKSKFPNIEHIVLISFNNTL